MLRLQIGTEQEFTGVYVMHWEITRFVVYGTPRLFGLITPKVRCKLEIPAGVAVPWAEERAALQSEWHRCPGLSYAVKLRGVVVEKGYFGHKGICRYKIRVNEFLEAEKCSGRPW